MADKLSPLASVSETRTVLEHFGLMTKKALGQHFLINDGVVQKICSVADVSVRDVVIEVGPGIGTLTVALLQKAGAVIAVERDADLPQVLAETTAPYTQSTFILIEDDALNVTEDYLRDAIKLSAQGNLVKLPNKLISNLPYAVAATIVLDYFEKLPINSATVMVQAEVADRMMACPGTKNYGAYTVKLALYAHPVSRFSVAESNFFPPPRVKSAVVRFDRNTIDESTKQYQRVKDKCVCSDAVHEPHLAAEQNTLVEQSLLDEQRLATKQSLTVEQRCALLTNEERHAAAIMADAAFTNRRKTIANSCKTYFNNAATIQAAQIVMNGKDIVPHLTQIFEQAGISPQTRGETLTVAQYIDLGKALLNFVLSF